MAEVTEASKIIVITGPTASGKTAAAMELCRIFNGEIVSADSMQIYRYMDIGTAKPTDKEKKATPHHLIDILNPDEEYSAALYRLQASEAIESIRSRKKTVFVTGGAGLYIEALLGGLIAAPPADQGFRDYCRREAASRGLESLHDLLEEKDPLAASRIHPHDSVRVIRALEVLEHTGMSIFDHKRKHDFSNASYDCFKICLSPDRETLYTKINERTDDMISQGLVAETVRLMAMGYDDSCPAMKSFCYRHMIDFIRGEISQDEAVRRLKRDTRNYAKRQIAWFRRDKDISLYVPGATEEMADAVSMFLDLKPG
ncbi:MAG: tRNA (adenosine(37)-N6)-dimethylallyltransferase MiaA [Syntrophales bacterium]|nr:tRNA (adenosine(37)-N6)-dimethylallyltransferase MiaA [Syntrophales bacterium]